jgi:predicted  nucleic acid-binding Zn-ribbon protein
MSEPIRCPACGTVFTPDEREFWAECPECGERLLPTVGCC